MANVLTTGYASREAIVPIPPETLGSYYPVFRWSSYIASAGDASGGFIRHTHALGTDQETEVLYFTLTSIRGHTDDSNSTGIVVHLSYDRWKELLASGSTQGLYLTCIDYNVVSGIWAVDTTNYLPNPQYLGRNVIGSSAVIVATYVANTDGKNYITRFAGYGYSKPPYSHSNLIY